MGKEVRVDRVELEDSELKKKKKLKAKLKANLGGSKLFILMIILITKKYNTKQREI